jgi:hypothetical protein
MVLVVMSKPLFANGTSVIASNGHILHVYKYLVSCAERVIIRKFAEVPVCAINQKPEPKIDYLSKE